MRRTTLATLFLVCAAALVTLAAAPAPAGSGYHLLKKVTLGGEGGWDYLSADPVSHRVYLSRGTHIMVVDADGLNAFEGRTDELNGKGRTLVITPHPGEMARLVGCTIADVQKDRLGVARKFAREHEVIVVLKGHRTLVVQPDGEIWVNTTGNPGMATGGTGDILTGMVAGMIAQHSKENIRKYRLKT